MAARWNLLHREALLQCLVSIGVETSSHRRVADIHVLFVDAEMAPAPAHGDPTLHHLLATDFVTALDFAVNDIYWNEDSDWSEATMVVVDPAY